MNTTSLKPGIQKTINNISEIWFLLILAVPTIFDATFEIGSKGKWTISFTLLSIAVILISILIKQLIQKTAWISLVLGVFLCFFSSFFIAAALSEYDEFPLGTEPNALSLLAFGTIVGGISFALAIKMSFQGAYKLYTD